MENQESAESVRVVLFQEFPVNIAMFQYAHLMNGDLVKFYQSFTLRHSLFDENRIEVFHI